MKQLTFSDLEEDEGEESESETPRLDVPFAYDADDSCPFCMAPRRMLDESGETVGCTRCHSRIPVDAEWYQNGKKAVADVKEAADQARMFSSQ